MLFTTNPIIKLISLISRKTLLEEVCEYLKSVETSILDEEEVGNDKLCINNDKLCINNDKLCINNDKLCINNDKLCINNDKLFIKEEGKLYLLDESKKFILNLVSLDGDFENSIEELKSDEKSLYRFLISITNINQNNSLNLNTDLCTYAVKTLVRRMTFLNLLENKEKYELIQNKAISKKLLPEPLKFLKGEFNLLSKEINELDNKEVIYKVFLRRIIEAFPGKLEQEIMNWDFKDKIEAYINDVLLILKTKIQLYCFMWSKIKEVESYKYFRTIADYEDLEYDYEYIKRNYN